MLAISLTHLCQGALRVPETEIGGQDGIVDIIDLESHLLDTLELVGHLYCLDKLGIVLVLDGFCPTTLQ